MLALVFSWCLRANASKCSLITARRESSGLLQRRWGIFVIDGELQRIHLNRRGDNKTVLARSVSLSERAEGAAQITF